MSHGLEMVLSCCFSVIAFSSYWMAWSLSTIANDRRRR